MGHVAAARMEGSPRSATAPRDAASGSVLRPLRSRAQPWLLGHVPLPLAALAASLALLAVGDGLPGPAPAWVPVGIAGGVSFLRSLTARRALRHSTLALDAAGAAILVAGTGGIASPFYPMALGGVVWAARIPRSHGAAVHLLAVSVLYVLLVVPAAMAGEAVTTALALLAGLLAAGLLAGRQARRLVLRHGPPPGAIAGSRGRPLTPSEVLWRRRLAQWALRLEVPIQVILEEGRDVPNDVQTEILELLLSGEGRRLV